jgi:uncharacterized protein with LGFP repeats
MNNCVVKVAVIVSSEKQWVYEIISLSANTVDEIVNHLVDNTSKVKLKNFCKFWEYSVVPDKSTYIAEVYVLIRRSVTRFKLRRSL